MALVFPTVMMPQVMSAFVTMPAVPSFPVDLGTRPCCSFLKGSPEMQVQFNTAQTNCVGNNNISIFRSLCAKLTELTSNPSSYRESDQFLEIVLWFDPFPFLFHVRVTFPDPYLSLLTYLAAVLATCSEFDAHHVHRRDRCIKVRKNTNILQELYNLKLKIFEKHILGIIF